MSTMTDDELKAAVFRRAGYLRWLADGIGDDDAFDWYEGAVAELDKQILSGWAMDRLAADAAERSEREKPIDEEWLLSIGFYPTTDRGDLFHHNDIAGAFIIHSLGVISWGCEVYDIGEFTTRGQLIDLLRALDVVAKGGA